MAGKPKKPEYNSVPPHWIEDLPEGSVRRALRCYEVVATSHTWKALKSAYESLREDEKKDCLKPERETDQKVRDILYGYGKDLFKKGDKVITPKNDIGEIVNIYTLPVHHPIKRQFEFCWVCDVETKPDTPPAVFESTKLIPA